MKNILIDSCFWFALLTQADQHHSKAKKIEEILDHNKIMLPFPSLYETLNTKFTKQEKCMRIFEEYKKRTNTTLICDTEYRDKALSTTFFSKNRPMALVDTTIRLMLEDTNLNINALVTFNREDFDDICRKRGIELVSK